MSHLNIHLGKFFHDQTAEVTLNGGLVRESPQNPLNSGLGIILICPDSLCPVVFAALYVLPTHS